MLDKDDDTRQPANTTYLAPKMTQMDLKDSFLNANMWTFNDPRAPEITRKNHSNA